MPDSTPLLIGISARIYYPAAPVLDIGGVFTKTLHYLEQSVAHWVMSRHVLAVMIPAVDADSIVKRKDISLRRYADMLDGLVLQGGNDIAPETYGETPIDPRWHGDRVRDRYEMQLVEAFIDAGKPVLGICRGHQLINVAFGGTLYQDIPTQLPQAITHLDTSLYDRRLHAVNIVQGTHLARLYSGTTQAAINSIHHQAVKDLGRDLVVEALAVPDGLVEAIRWRGPSYVFGMQWHPEFMALETLDEEQLDGKPILADFLDAVRRRKVQATAAPKLAVA
ncbi:type 1 glutamine amidotransferase [Azohydromonas sp.]|uniref:gamma-glutamyl-gamma-aminobutyrate hydrolase family protein n=1 Tax=Azohydromonas sp. TaxID=1872666 RepID=UPI002BF0C114|nr:type 1 glutamine amidotransferase [Azohydromonas sp.]HMM83851.1 type 1 glutamine amidotransferase [Azohydromonas sp.]